MGWEIEWWWSYYVPQNVTLWTSGWFRQTQADLTEGQIENLAVWVRREIKASRMTQQPWRRHNGELEILVLLSTDPTASFQVDEEGWLYSYQERWDGLTVIIRPREPSWGGMITSAFARWSEVPDKPTAYCLARCRVAIKAKGKG